MFFTLSKLLGFLSVPSNLLIVVGLLGLGLLLFTRWERLGSWLIVTSLVLLALAGLSPLGNALILPLEDRFPPWDASHGPPDGIIMLGGAISPDVSAARGSVAFDDAAERVTATVELARRYPNARVIVSGGSNTLVFEEAIEAVYAVQELVALGVPHDRITAEEQSRNTVENAVFSRLVANPKPGERWLLVTSAFHMPRAVGAFRAAGFPIEPYPVDWRTRGPKELLWPILNVANGLQRTDTAAHEWIGLIAYWLAGKSNELLPGP
jgi:uncharacterized SAM-binding protein YcdF (DUF218 family)